MWLRAVKSIFYHGHANTREESGQEKARSWLMLLIMLKSFLMALWIGREFFYSQSYECVVVFGADELNSTYIKPPRFLVINDPPGELLPIFQQQEHDTPAQQTRTPLLLEVESNRDRRFLADINTVFINTKPAVLQKGKKKWVKKVVRRRKKKPAPAKRTVQLALLDQHTIQDNNPSSGQIHSSVQMIPLKSLEEGVIRTKTTQKKALYLPTDTKKRIKRIRKKKVRVHNAQTTAIKRTEKRYLPASEPEIPGKPPVETNDIESLIQEMSSIYLANPSHPNSSQAPLPKPNVHQFLDQFDAFKLTVVCVGRTLLNLWCLVQCLTAIPFLIGIYTKDRCLLIPHLTLDALFLVILFIYGITITVFSFVLFVLVDAMYVETLANWLMVAGALNVGFAVYTLLFTLTLRCSELSLRRFTVVNNSKKNRSKSLLYTEVGSVETVEDCSEDRLEEVDFLA